MRLLFLLLFCSVLCAHAQVSSRSDEISDSSFTGILTWRSHRQIIRRFLKEYLLKEKGCVWWRIQQNICWSRADHGFWYLLYARAGGSTWDINWGKIIRNCPGGWFWNVRWIHDTGEKLEIHSFFIDVWMKILYDVKVHILGNLWCMPWERIELWEIQEGVREQ